MSRPCVLCVEADAARLGALRELVEGAGYSLDVVGDGRAALQRLQRRPRPTLILMALELPGMGGVDTAAMIRGDPTLADIPVIAVTRDGEEPPPEGTFQAVWSEPVAPEMLAEAAGPPPPDRGPLASVRRSLEELLAAEGSPEVSLQEAIATVERLAEEHPARPGTAARRDPEKA